MDGGGEKLSQFYNGLDREFILLHFSGDFWLEIAREMKADGQPTELIMSFTKLSPEEIEKL